MASPLRLKQTYYEPGEKPGRILAWLIKQLQNERSITIQSSKGDNIVNLTEINDAFRFFNEGLYNSNKNVDLQIQKTFLDDLNIPSIPEELRSSLEV